MNNSFFSTNRKNLMEMVEDNSIALFFQGKAPKKTADEGYPFTPNRNFYYLTGITDMHVILCMEKINNEVKNILFIERYDEVKAKWVGKTVSDDEAREISGIDTIMYLDQFEAFIHSKINADVIKTMYFDLEKDGFKAELNEGGKFAKELKANYPQVEIRNAYQKVCSLRLIKSSDEIKEMKKAIEITKNGIYNVFRNAKANVKEYEMEAEFDYVLKKSGVRDFAFKTICAAGINATVLHYVENNTEIKDNELLLLDLGAQWNYYSADISRTFPINGKFTEEQRKYYDIVLLAHKRVFEAIKPGLPFKRLNEIVKETYAEELKKTGLIKEDSEVFKYYFHGVSHYLGLDTHDVGSRDTELKEGMVITVEPGLYIPELNIGIRIEDDALVTKDGVENLSIDIIREADEIEKYMKENNINLH